MTAIGVLRHYVWQTTHDILLLLIIRQTLTICYFNSNFNSNSKHKELGSEAKFDSAKSWRKSWEWQKLWEKSWHQPWREFGFHRIVKVLKRGIKLRVTVLWNPTWLSQLSELSHIQIWNSGRSLIPASVYGNLHKRLWIHKRLWKPVCWTKIPITLALWVLQLRFGHSNYTLQCKN